MAKLAIFKNKKFRPWIIGAVVLVGGLVLFMMLRANAGGSSAGASAGGASGPSEGLQMAQLQAGVASQQASLQANVAMSQIAAEVESYRYGQDTGLAVAGIEATTAQYMAMVQGNVQLAGIGAQRDVALAGEKTNQIGIGAQAAVQQAGILSQQNIAQYQYQFMTEQEKQRTEQTKIGANAQKKASTNNLIGGIVGGVLGLFSDVRLKEDVTWTGESGARVPQGRGFDEYGRYSWTYRGDGGGSVWHGVIAQEVRRTAPATVLPTRAGRYLSVDYGALPG